MKKNILLFLLLLCTTSVWGGPVTIEQAQQSAMSFLANRKGGNTRGLKVAWRAPQLSTAADDPSYYVFNVGQQQGFVIVSGDDHCNTILGYADEGSFDANNMPVNMKAWLDGYAQQIAALKEAPATPTAPKTPRKSARRIMVKKDIAPLMMTNWNQSAPYNDLCPSYIIPQTGKSERCATGCVATTYAQCLYYVAQRYKEENGVYPFKATQETIPSYTDNGSTRPSIPKNTAIDWDHMLTDYVNGNYTEEQAKAVANLMKICGRAVQMNYGSESAANDALIASTANQYFGFDCDAKYVSACDYGFAEWIDLIYSELKERRVVPYSGGSMGGGHSFVCDGYATDDFFHINWGWGGMSNGFFRLSVCDPDQLGIGGGSGGYSMYQGAVVGFYPNYVNPKLQGKALTTMSLYTTTPKLKRKNSQNEFPNITVVVNAYNMTGEEATFEHAMGLFDQNGTLMRVYAERPPLALGNGWGFSDAEYKFSINSTIPSGAYRIKPVSRVNGEVNWQANEGTQKLFLDATITATELTLQQPQRYVTATLSVEGEGKVGQEMTVVAHISNEGTIDETGNVHLIIDQQDQEVSNTGYSLPVGKSGDYALTFTPTAEGTYTLILQDDDENDMAVLNDVLIAPAEGVSSPDLTITIDISNANGQRLLGDRAMGHWSIKNNLAEDFNSYVGIQCYNSNNEFMGEKYGYVSIAGGQTLDLDFDFAGLTVGDHYFLATYYYDFSQNKYIWGPSSEWLTTVAAVKNYTADGQCVFKELAQTYMVPENVVAVDLEGISGVRNVVRNNNPNTIYYVDDNTAALVTDNAIINREAEHISLTDGYDFGVPMAFTARNINYSRKMAYDARTGSTSRQWETIVLPFAPTAITDVTQNRLVNWYRTADDKDKDFWLGAYTDENEEGIVLTPAAQFEANTPYFIRVAHSNLNGQHKLSGHTLLFSAQNAYLTSENTPTLTGANYKLMGNSQWQDADTRYMLNSTGNAFVQDEQTAIGPFRAHVASTLYGTVSQQIKISYAGDNYVPYGDANGDGVIDIVDITHAARLQRDDTYMQALDIDQDGSIGFGDVQLIEQEALQAE